MILHVGDFSSSENEILAKQATRLGGPRSSWYFWGLESTCIHDSLSSFNILKGIEYAQQCRDFYQVGQHVVSCLGCLGCSLLWCILTRWLPGCKDRYGFLWQCLFRLSLHWPCSILGCFWLSRFFSKLDYIDGSNSSFIIIIICDWSDAYIVLVIYNGIPKVLLCLQLKEAMFLRSFGLCRWVIWSSSNYSPSWTIWEWLSHGGQQ